MDDTTQSTDVTSDSSPVAAEASTSETAPSVGQSGEQATASGDVTAQPATEEGNVVQEGEATPPPDAEDDPLKDIPSAAELEQQVSQKVPYAQALLNLRNALEARNSELAELRGKAEPVAPLVEQYGGAETVKTRLETFDSLFTPVINQQTQQPEIDQSTGFPRITATPFIERVDAENPGMAEQLLQDALYYKVDFGNGQKIALHQHPAVQQVLLEACGLDPARADDYRNIDALSAPQDTGAVTPEDLTKVPDEFHDVFKALPAGIRQDLLMQDEATRQFNLEAHKERFDNKAAAAQRAEAEARERQAAETNARQYVAKEQESYVAQELQAGHAAIMTDLASQVTFGDAASNAVMHGVVSAAVLALRDPDASFAVTPLLDALGVKVDQSFYEALSDADKHMRDAKAYELFGQQGLAQKARTEANSAKKLVMAKAAPIALKLAKALGGQVVARATQQNKALDDATTTRPIPNDGRTTAEGGGLLPEGMLANDPRAGLILARQAGLTR